MYALDHNPPHFHVLSNDGRECLVQIALLSVIRGSVSAAALDEAVTWATANSAGLRARWKVLNP